MDRWWSSRNIRSLFQTQNIQPNTPLDMQQKPMMNFSSNPRLFEKQKPSSMFLPWDWVSDVHAPRHFLDLHGSLVLPAYLAYMHASKVSPHAKIRAIPRSTGLGGLVWQRVGSNHIIQTECDPTMLSADSVWAFPWASHQNCHTCSFPQRFIVPKPFYIEGTYRSKTYSNSDVNQLTIMRLSQAMKPQITGDTGFNRPRSAWH